MPDVGRMQTPVNSLPRGWLIACVATLLLAGAPAVAKVPELARDTPVTDHVTDILPYPVSFVRHRIGLLFDSGVRDYYDDYPGAIYDLPAKARSVRELDAGDYREFFLHPLVKQDKFYVFYGAYPLMQQVLAKLDVLAAMGHDNAALQDYAHLPAAARVNDVYLWSPDVPFWHSEYSMGGKALPFRSYFILHVEASGENATRIEVIDNQPVVAFYDSPNVDVHGTVHDTRLVEVEPTNHEREFLLSCIGQFIERKVPGRHWFNCRRKGEIVEPVVPWTVP